MVNSEESFKHDKVGCGNMCMGSDELMTVCSCKCHSPSDRIIYSGDGVGK